MGSSRVTLTVHHLNESRSHRVLFLLEELGVPYEIRRYERDAKTMMAPPELKAVHPLGKSPVVTDGALTLAETGHIIDTLIDHQGQGRLRPGEGSPERLLYDYYLHYAEGSLGTLMMLGTIVSMMPKQAPLPMRPVAAMMGHGLETSFIGPQLKLHLDFLESELGLRPWFAGQELTGADAIMSFPLQAFRMQGKLEGYPALLDWLQRLEARPAWARTIEKGGPLTLKFD